MDNNEAVREMFLLNTEVAVTGFFNAYAKAHNFDIQHEGIKDGFIEQLTLV